LANPTAAKGVVPGKNVGTRPSLPRKVGKKKGACGGGFTGAIGLFRCRTASKLKRVSHADRGSSDSVMASVLVLLLLLAL
jgi:hypothetical protein